MTVLPRTSRRSTTVFDPTLILSCGVYFEANSTVVRCGVHEELNGPVTRHRFAARRPISRVDSAMGSFCRRGRKDLW